MPIGGRCVWKIGAVDAGDSRARVHDGEKFTTRRQSPIRCAAQRSCIDRCNVVLRIALIAVRGECAATDVRAERTGVTAVGGGVGGVPSEGVADAPQAAGGFDFPDEAGDVVFGAGPVAGGDAERGAGAERAAVVGDFAVIKARRTRANFGKRPGGRLCIAPVSSVLAGVHASISADRRATRHRRVRRVVTTRLAGVVERFGLGVAAGGGQDKKRAEQRAGYRFSNL